MASALPDLVIRVANAGEVGALAWLRSLGRRGAGEDSSLEGRMAAWLAADGDRRTTLLAWLSNSPVGMASVLEYRRMPRPGHRDSRWGYVGNCSCARTSTIAA